MSGKHCVIIGSVMTLIVGAMDLALRLTVISDPNQAWPIAVLIRNTVGIWWVVVIMSVFAFEHAAAAWLVLRHRRNRT